MNPQDLEMEKSAQLDGEVGAEFTGQGSHEVPKAWEDLRAHLQTGDTIQTPDADWMFARIQQELKREERVLARNRFVPLLKWAACLILLLGLVAILLPKGSMDASEGSGVLWVETHLPDSSSIVYEDAETGVTVVWMVSEEGA